MIKSLLIANRGEIACRVIRTARRLGVRTVAVYSDADAKALHVRMADEAVHIGPSPARESYLVGERIIAAAQQTGAEAIHPGYGFLSENAEFAQSVIDAGLVWVGPKPASITAMGLKDAAKKLMAAAGVPVTPGYMGEDQSPAHLATEAGKIGYPVLIKAVAGGGGKGMRLVERAEDFADALASCQREAASSFGNAHVLIEKYILSPRHIEVQVFGDSHGNVVHLFERDCSLQRRHQKVIEEAPAPGMDAATREELCAAAVRAAKAVDYQGAGTIEFIADGSEGLRADRIWFMEMNTRLQVEHPVTEEVTGVDLVEWQLRVASGEPLPKRQDELSIDGWAMEARLYAEDPGKGFLPSTGRLEHLQFYGAGMAPRMNNGDHAYALRIDTGVEKGDAVSAFYDPMIAKIVCWSKTREEAASLLETACHETQVWPIRSNAGFLANLAADPDFRAGTVTTGHIAARFDDLVARAQVGQALFNRAAKWLALTEAVPQGPSGFRLNAAPQTTRGVWIDGQRFAMEVADAGLVQHFKDQAWSEARNPDHPVAYVDYGDYAVAFDHGEGHIVARGVRAQGGAGMSSGAILSPMPGKIIAVEVTQGQQVTKGQKLLTLEAMKMEHTLIAPFDGVVAELNASAGQQVQVEALLARIEAPEEKA